MLKNMILMRTPLCAVSTSITAAANSRKIQKKFPTFPQYHIDGGEFNRRKQCISAILWFVPLHPPDLVTTPAPPRPRPAKYHIAKSSLSLNIKTV